MLKVLRTIAGLWEHSREGRTAAYYFNRIISHWRARGEVGRVVVYLSGMCGSGSLWINAKD